MIFRKSKEERSDRSRAQTTLDFAIGASIFLFAVAFILGLFPVILEPFQLAEENPAKSITAERASSTLVDEKLDKNPVSERRNVLDEECTAHLFAEDGVGADGCAFDGDDDIDDIVATGDRQDIRVVITDIEGNDVEELTVNGETVTLEAGIDDPDAGSVSKTRIVYIGGEYYRLNITAT